VNAVATGKRLGAGGLKGVSMRPMAIVVLHEDVENPEIITAVSSGRHWTGC
jgi:hypothetical protein